MDGFMRLPEAGGKERADPSFLFLLFGYAARAAARKCLRP